LAIWDLIHHDGGGLQPVHLADLHARLGRHRQNQFLVGQIAQVDEDLTQRAPLLLLDRHRLFELVLAQLAHLHQDPPDGSAAVSVQTLGHRLAFRPRSGPLALGV